jgi:ASCH domain
VKALSIRQPWAWLIVNGFKPVENRTWESFYRGPLLIHAGQTMTRADHAACRLFIASDERLREVLMDLPDFDSLERGGIVGQAVMTGCVRRHTSPWYTGDFGFLLDEAKPLPFRPLKGALGIFEAGVSA